MNQVVIPSYSHQTKSRFITTKILLLLLIFTPLIYSVDGDQYRAYEIVIVGLLFLMIAPPNLLRVSLWIHTGIIYILALVLIIAIQPIFVEGAKFLYNINYIVALISSFIPSLYLSSFHSDRSSGDDSVIQKSLGVLFVITVTSLAISFAAGIGEVYTSEGVLSRRAFAWLGDSFSPVMVFFLYYYIFMRSMIRVIIAMTCLLIIMQAKMALGMAIIGYLIYQLIFGRKRIRLVAASIITLGLLASPILLRAISPYFHNLEYSFNNRLLSYESALVYFQSSPLFGVGANQTFTLLSNGFDLTDLGRYTNDLAYYEFFQIHNSFLRILAELGIVGFIIFLIFCLAIIRRSYFVLKIAYVLPLSETRSLLMACALWLISFVLFYQTTGWFEAGHPQLSWIICFLTIMNYSINNCMVKKSTRSYSFNNFHRKPTTTL